MTDTRMTKLQKNNRADAGTTMVETLVAFTVLAIILTVLFHIVSFCSELYMLTADNAAVNERFLQEVRKNDDKMDASLVEKVEYTGIKAEGKKEVLFYLTLDEERMGEAAMESYKDCGNSDEDIAKRFELNCLGARSYLSTDPVLGEHEEKLTPPAIMNFVFESLLNTGEEP